MADVQSTAAPDPRERTLARFRTTLGAATLLMLLLSRRLWIEGEAIARVPFIAGMPAPSVAGSWVVFGLLVAAIAMATAGLAWRAATGAAIVLFVVLFLQDQHRFQPWAYQFVMLGLIVACLPPAQAIRYARWWFAALYFHSGLSKLDVSFCREIGALFLATALRPMRVDPAMWSESRRTSAVLAMPAWEIAVALALVVPRTRRIGLAGALLLHGALLFILGPLGLRHSTIVLVWNAAMMVELAILFGPQFATDSSPIVADGWLVRPVKAVFWAAVVLPMGERSGWFDAWPSHALYASHVERTAVYLHDERIDETAPGLRTYLVGDGGGPWLRLDLTAWSRAERGVPVYPQARACNGLAEALAARYGGRLLIRVIHLGRADRWTGRRARVESLGLEAIRREGDRFWLNAHPAPAIARRGAGPGRRPRGRPGS